ncbi:MAG: DNA polymerase III subunit gamma/tau [Nitrospira sp. SB0667_bin_9]|nr:DNA polymerase III subunit gamma/tau [Nitrospira sp. SB0667_bin_9]MYD30804.1 DNA polymerase III subunit gamma/tau [Nitrospira sp. SB0661_bin_20]MYJ22388.1 DNA polymerase III subunit gamma/tau [Nitrospira sp. SB0673_bin_12]
MEYQVSARKFRPGTFEELIGQPHVVQTLRNAILRQQVAHAYLFSGMRGVGKTTAARILAKALNCEKGPTPEPCGQCEGCLEITRGNSVDVIEIDGASNTGVDDVRELRENVKFSPFRGTYRIYIIDEVHMLSNSAFNALLKTLEEPPSHAVFIFATTEVHKIPPTITSRCQHFNFRRIPRREIIARLQEVVTHVGVTINERSLGAMARASEGSMRDALSLLDQAVAFGSQSIAEHDVDEMLGAVPDELVGRLVQTVVAQDPAGAVALVGEVVDHGYDLRAYCGAVVERMRHLMIAAVVPGFEQAQGLMDLPDEDVKHLLTEAKSFSVEQVQEIFHLFAQAEDRLRSTAHPRFVFEVAAVRAARLLQPGAQVLRQAETGRGAQPQTASAPAEKPRPAPGQAERPSPPAQRPPASHAARAPRAARPAVEAKSASQPRPASPGSSPAIREEDWQRVVDSVIQDAPNIGTHLEMGTLVKIEGNQVIVGFPKTAAVACSRIQKEETRALIAKVCQTVAGVSIRLRVVELTGEPDDGLTIRQMRNKRREQDDEALLSQVRANPMVKHAMELFGCEVVKASRPSGKKEA